MGIRSYLLVGDRENFSQLLEANNVVPLLWLCAFSPADLGEGLDDGGPTLRLTDGAGYGMGVDGAAAIANLKRRQETLLPWLSKEAAKIYRQFSKFIGAQKARQLRLDLAEWGDASNSLEQASAELRALFAALDTPPPKTLPHKRTPKAIKWLLEHYDFASLNQDLPNLALALGGTSYTVCEPWRREPARDRRLPDDFLRWSNSDPNLSANGQTIVVKVKNSAGLDTPMVWSRGGDSCVAIPIDEAIEAFDVNHVSGNGRVLFGTGKSYPGPVSFMFRYDEGRLEMCSDALRPAAWVCASSDDGAVAVGPMGSGKYDDGSKRAFVWRVGHDPVCLLDSDLESEATHMTPDGRFIAGTQTIPDGSGVMVRAFVWSEADGMTVAVEDCRAKWLALGPDGDCGVLETLNVPRGVGNHVYWRKGEALRPITDADGNALTGIRISAAADAVLGDYADQKGAAGALVLWRPDQPVQTIALPADGTLWPQYVGNGGTMAIVAVDDLQTRATREMLVWSADGGILSHAMAYRGGLLAGGIWERNRSAKPEQFVAVGKFRSSYLPYIWTAEHGVELCPGDVELARAKPKTR